MATAPSAWPGWRPILVIPAKSAVSTRILLNEAGATETPGRHRGIALFGGVLLPVGLAFLVAGGADLVLTWLPAAFGSAEWEFGTITQTLNGLPVPTMGLVLVGLWGAATARRWVVLTTGIVWVVLALCVLGMGGLYGLTVPVALKSTSNPLILLGLKKSIARSLVQVVAYAAAYFWLAFGFMKRASTS